MPPNANVGIAFCDLYFKFSSSDFDLRLVMRLRDTGMEQKLPSNLLAVFGIFAALDE